MNVIHVKSYRHFCNKIWQGFSLANSKLGTTFKPNNDFKVRCLIHVLCLFNRKCFIRNEPLHEKINNLGWDQVRHEPAYARTEGG